MHKTSKGKETDKNQVDFSTFKISLNFTLMPHFLYLYNFHFYQNSKYICSFNLTITISKYWHTKSSKGGQKHFPYLVDKMNVSKILKWRRNYGQADIKLVSKLTVKEITDHIMDGSRLLSLKADKSHLLVITYSQTNSEIKIRNALKYDRCCMLAQERKYDIMVPESSSLFLQ